MYYTSLMFWATAEGSATALTFPKRSRVAKMSGKLSKSSENPVASKCDKVYLF